MKIKCANHGRRIFILRSGTVKHRSDLSLCSEGRVLVGDSTLSFLTVFYWMFESAAPRR